MQEHATYLRSNPKYAELVTFLDDKLWRPLAPQLSQLAHVMKEFQRLRRCLTSQEYKNQIVDTEKLETGSTIPFDQLIEDWAQLGKINKKNRFHQRFKKAADALKRHYKLVTPAMLDESLPRTTSALENLNGRIKHFLRKWSGTKKLRQSFQWAAPLAAICQSQTESKLYQQILEQQTVYDWIEKTGQLALQSSNYRSEVRFANATASKTPSGLVSMVAHLIFSDLRS